MNNLLGFRCIMQGTRAWVTEITKSDKYSEFRFQIVRDDESCFRLLFYFKDCLGQIIVSCDDGVRPYRFVEMEIVSRLEDVKNPIFIWFDSESDDLNSVISNLEKGLDFVIHY